MKITKTHYLIDFLSCAQIQAPHKKYVTVQPMTIEREANMSLFNHPPASVTFPNLKLEEAPILKTACGIKPSCWNLIHARVYFKMTLTDERGKKKVIFKTSLRPSHSLKDRNWKPCQVDLSPYAHQTVSLTLETYTRWRQGTAWCWAGWANPHIQQKEMDGAHQRSRHPSLKQPLILLVTGDALRADFLRCYGHQISHTPFIDELANQGCLFSHARAQSPCTIGSYASLLSGMHAYRHGIHAEWGRVPSHLDTLPHFLARQGYHTVFASSEEDITRPQNGFKDLFHETLPCLAVPAQDGDITTRQVIRRLEQGFNKPTFLWVQYFDTHPPYIATEPFKSMYYPFDPTDPSRQFKKQCISKIRGMEAIAEIDYAFTMISEGRRPYSLYERLRATVRTMRNPGIAGPDLAEHLLSMGPDAYRQMPLDQFANWLEKESQDLLSSHPSSELLNWLKETRKRLSLIEYEIISWLEDVKDYRYPLAQYMSGVSYFDRQVGSLIESLKKLDLYESATFILTSPHGEVLGEHEVYFHHHALIEEVLRIPLIIKFPQGRIASSPLKIEGIMDSIDVFPTLCDALNLPSPQGIDGVSRWPSINEQTKIPDHDSFAVDYNQSMLSLAHGSFIFLKALKDCYFSPHWNWQRGQRGLYSLSFPSCYQNNIMHQQKNLFEAMEATTLRYENSLSHPSVSS